MPKDGNVNEWGEYYLGKKGGWSLELVNRVNNAIPRFTELFDQDTFYLTALLVVVATFVGAFVASRHIKIKPHQM